MLEKRNYMTTLDAPEDMPEPIPLWSDGVKDNLPHWEEPEKLTERGSTYHNRKIEQVSIPGIYCLPASAQNNCRKAILVLPGGGYKHLAIDHEGFAVARFLNSIGVSAFVLKYRDPAPGEVFGTAPDAPLIDALRAMRLIRSWSDKYGYDADKIGVMGFSAGGHLCCCVSTMYDRFDDTELKDISARPDFSIPIYPVVSIIEKQIWASATTGKRLLGLDCTFEKKKYYSPECFVDSKTPPAFLIHAADDPGVSPFNSILYFQALLAAGVPAEMHIFQEGSHGFGMKVTADDKPVSYWIDLLANWLKTF
ncbi:MAG: alpha/beta hydrolase [Victivallales bacterium]|nr:alpha/beta hydrolase [Victivallales bacterium]